MSPGLQVVTQEADPGPGGGLGAEAGQQVAPLQYSTAQHSTVSTAQHSTAKVAPEDPRHQAEVVQPGGRVHGELQGGEGGALGPVVLASQARGAARGHITGTRGTDY